MMQWNDAIDWCHEWCHEKHGPSMVQAWSQAWSQVWPIWPKYGCGRFLLCLCLYIAYLGLCMCVPKMACDVNICVIRRFWHIEILYQWHWQVNGPTHFASGDYWLVKASSSQASEEIGPNAFYLRKLHRKKPKRQVQKKLSYQKAEGPPRLDDTNE